MKKLPLILLMPLILTSLAACSSDNEVAITQNTVALPVSSAMTKTTPSPNAITLKHYKYSIGKIDDLGKNSLVDARGNFVDAPIKKLRYHIVVSEIKADDVKNLLHQAVNDIIAADKTIDELIVWAHSDADAATNYFDVGEAIWAKDGKLGSYTNGGLDRFNRTNYDITYKVADNLDTYLKNKSNIQVINGRTEEERKTIYYDLTEAELNGIRKADKLFPDYGLEHMNKSGEFIKQNKKVLYQKYHLTNDEELAIAGEGLDKNWKEAR